MRLGGTLRLCVGVLDLFEEADLLAPCQLFNITLDQFTFVISSRATTWTVETTSMCSGRHLLSPKSIATSAGQHPPLYFISLSPTLVLHCVLLLSSVGIAYAPRLSVVVLFHLIRLPRHKQSTPTTATMHHATMQSHANGPSWFALRYPA